MPVGDPGVRTRADRHARLAHHGGFRFADPVPDLAEIQAIQKDAGNTPLKFAVVSTGQGWLGQRSIALPITSSC